MGSRPPFLHLRPFPGPLGIPRRSWVLALASSLDEQHARDARELSRGASATARALRALSSLNPSVDDEPQAQEGRSQFRSALKLVLKRESALRLVRARAPLGRLPRASPRRIRVAPRAIRRNACCGGGGGKPPRWAMWASGSEPLSHVAVVQHPHLERRAAARATRLAPVVRVLSLHLLPRSRLLNAKRGESISRNSGIEHVENAEACDVEMGRVSGTIAFAAMIGLSGCGGSSIDVGIDSGTRDSSAETGAAPEGGTPDAGWDTGTCLGAGQSCTAATCCGVGLACVGGTCSTSCAAYGHACSTANPCCMSSPPDVEVCNGIGYCQTI